MENDITRLLTHNMAINPSQGLSVRYRGMLSDDPTCVKCGSFMLYDKGREKDEILKILDRYDSDCKNNRVYNPVPLNFIVESPYYVNNGFPDYITRKLSKMGCIWNRGVANITINSNVRHVPSVSEFNRWFAGWTTVVKIVGTPQISVLRDLVFVLSKCNSKDICLIIDTSGYGGKDRERITEMMSTISSHNWYIIRNKFLTVEQAVEYSKKRYKELYRGITGKNFRFDWEKILSKERFLSYSLCDAIITNQVRIKLNKKYKLTKNTDSLILAKNTTVIEKPRYDMSLIDDQDADPFKKLDSLIGLNNVKEYITRAISHHHMTEVYNTKGMNVIEPSYNMAFFGNPGTAKTTCARLIGKIFYKEGIIKSPVMKEITRENLCGRYVGETAIKTKKLLNEVKSGIIFVDEAYSLSYSNYDGDYGMEAINEIVAAMDSRKDVVFIFAGYKKEMQEFIESNPGLSSRIPNNIEFVNYTKDELMKMLTDRFNAQGFVLDDKVSKYFSKKIDVDMHDSHFGNGRYIRTLVEQSILDHSVRLDKKGTYADKEIYTITVDDVPSMTKIAKDKNPVGFGTK